MIEFTQPYHDPLIKKQPLLEQAFKRIRKILPDFFEGTITFVVDIFEDSESAKTIPDTTKTKKQMDTSTGLIVDVEMLDEPEFIPKPIRQELFTLGGERAIPYLDALEGFLRKEVFTQPEFEDAVEIK